MKAAMLYGIKDLRIEEVETPRVGREKFLLESERQQLAEQT